MRLFTSGIVSSLARKGGGTHDGFVLLAFNKPYGVLSQFTPDGSENRPLAEFNFPKGVYALGRLDADSEGLLLFSDEAGLNTKLLDPSREHVRVYWAQVESIPSAEALRDLAAGPIIQGRKSEACGARLIEPNPEPPTRDPPIRERKSIPTAWIELRLIEGKNRQVRRMTAAVGHPTLRLIRVQIGSYKMPPDLAPGAWRELSAAERQLVFTAPSAARRKS
jgi:23S rRNA pseudouridine2457 synthase